MSIKFALLGLLDAGPRGAAALRRDFAEATGDLWPLNLGQVTQTLDRAVRDGLVEQSGVGTSGGREVVEFRITAGGRSALEEWYAQPVPRDRAERDEFAIKLASAVAAATRGESGSAGPDVATVIHIQRQGTMTALQELTRTLRGVDGQATVGVRTSAGGRASAGGLLLRREVFAAEAELRWLDHVEAALRAGADA